MATTNYYPYDYFCGANVFITVNGQPILEAAGISYTEQDSMQPIYGYSSRLFDAVAPGQKIIQGTLVINQVDPDYLYESVLRGRRITNDTSPDSSMDTTTIPRQTMSGEIENQPASVVQLGELWRQGSNSSLGPIAGQGYESEGLGHASDIGTVTAELESRYWDRVPNFETAEADFRASNVNAIRHTDLTLVGPTNIKIEFANKFSITLHSSFFVSRSSGIQIDENVILEEYSFFSRYLSVGDF